VSTSKGLGPCGGEGFLAGGSSRHTEQDEARHDDSGNDNSRTTAVPAPYSGSRLTPLTPVMPNGNPRSIKIVEGGYCSDTRYEEKLQEKGAQHKALEEALKEYGYNVTTLPIIIGQSGSQYHTTSDALAKIGVEHGPASKVMSKLHEHSVLTFHKILTSRSTRKGEDTQTQTEQARSTLG